MSEMSLIMTLVIITIVSTMSAFYHKDVKRELEVKLWLEKSLVLNKEEKLGDFRKLFDEKITELEKYKNEAYSERNRTVILFAKTALQLGLKAGVGKDDNTQWDDEWRNVVYIDLPQGQVSWHISPTEIHLLEGLPLS